MGVPLIAPEDASRLKPEGSAGLTDQVAAPPVFVGVTATDGTATVYE